MTFCRDCGRSKATNQLWERHNHPYCADCYRQRFGTHPGINTQEGTK